MSDDMRDSCTGKPLPTGDQSVYIHARDLRQGDVIRRSNRGTEKMRSRMVLRVSPIREKTKRVTVWFYNGTPETIPVDRIVYVLRD